MVQSRPTRRAANTLPAQTPSCPGRGRQRATGAGRRIDGLLRSQIADGTLAPGTPLPSTRGLAADLGVSRTTVTAAYEQLAAEGYLETSPGRAARVAHSLLAPGGGRSAGPAPVRDAASALPPRLSATGQRIAALALPPARAPDAAVIDFLYGSVAAADFPRQAWRQASQRVLRRQPAALAYGPPAGEAALRQALAGYLARARGLRCRPEQIVVVHGSQQAIALCAQLLLDPGDLAVVEDPGYGMARLCMQAAGATCLPVPVDAQGLRTEALPQGRPVRLAHVTPSHQFPLGGVLPVGRRRALLQWARQHGSWILEDDYDGEFRYGLRPVDALQALDADAPVLYIGTFSKALSPQLRLGYLVLPPPLVEVFGRAKRLADRSAPVLDQQVLAALIDDGSYERHVRRLRRAHERRRAALLAAIERHLPAGAQVAGAAAGLHVVLWLPGVPAADEAALVGAARQAGVGVSGVTPLYLQPGLRAAEPAAGLILGHASLDIAQIDDGLRRLGRLLARWPVPQG